MKSNQLKYRSLVLLCASTLFWVSCKEKEVEIQKTHSNCTQEVKEKGERVIGFDILDVTETGNFGDNYAKASQELKSEFIQLLQPWNAFENEQQGVYDGAAIQLYEILNDFALNTGAQLSLIIAPIDIPGRFLPSYLENKRFNDSLVIASFNGLIDHLFNPSTGVMNPENVLALSVGNEIDHYNWLAHNDQLADYMEFLQAIKPKINAYGIPLHFTATLYGLASDPNKWMELVNTVDKLSVTYYPMHADFTVKEPDVVYADMNTFLAKYPDTDIFIQEVGYPSSEKLNSNEEKQSQFFCHFFNVWDTHTSQLKHVSVLRLNDVSLTSARETAATYGIPGNQAFIEYIRTLGIRTWENTGKNKKAYELIKNELIKRNW